MIVVDASAALSALFNDGPSRSMLASEQLHAPHLVDSEIASGIRRRVAAQQLSADDGWTLLDRWRHLAVTRYALVSLLDRIWELRDNLSAYDAGYIALAEVLACPLLTADGRLARAPGVRCSVTVVPR